MPEFEPPAPDTGGEETEPTAPNTENEAVQPPTLRADDQIVQPPTGRVAEEYRPFERWTTLWAGKIVPFDRWTALWAGKVIVIGVTVAMFVIVYAVSSLGAKSYSASASSLITAGVSTSLGSNDAAQVSNEAAAQAVVFATTDAVIVPAARKVGVSPSVLRKSISAGTVNAQNVISIAAQTGSPHQSVIFANATALSLNKFLADQAAIISAATSESLQALQAKIASIQLQIGNLKGTVTPNSAEYFQVTSLEQELATLNSIEATGQQNANLAAATRSATGQIVSPATSASQVAPKPMLYALIGALLALLISSQAIIVIARRRYESNLFDSS